MVAVGGGGVGVAVACQTVTQVRVGGGDALATLAQDLGLVRVRQYTVRGEQWRHAATGVAVTLFAVDDERGAPLAPAGTAFVEVAAVADQDARDDARRRLRLVLATALPPAIHFPARTRPGTTVPGV